jgi:hypothetical protein
MTKTNTVEEAITSSLANFLEKRKASGDSCPCGPHDMAPIYQQEFGIEKADIEDEKFFEQTSKVRFGGLKFDQYRHILRILLQVPAPDQAVPGFLSSTGTNLLEIPDGSVSATMIAASKQKCQSNQPQKYKGIST